MAGRAERAGVSRRLGVLHTTEVVRLADVRIFVRDEPAISRSALLAAIDSRWTIAAIAAMHGVSDSTVRVELRRFGLTEAHRLR